MATQTLTLTLTTPQPSAPVEDKYVRRPTRQLPRSLIEGSRVPEPQTWSADKHLNFVSPPKVYTMKDLGLEGLGISPVAISEPFSLFSQEAIRQMRAEVFSDRVLEKHQYKSSFTSNMVRGQCPEDAPFTTDAWYDPRVLAAISQVAGIELVPCWDHDVANINISVPDADGTQAPGDHPSAEEFAKQQEQDMSAFGWHFDSVPFVCVTMLSDCTGMIGGETMIRTSRGEYLKMRGPTMGTAVVMQGRYIEHQALKALGGRERISMVTSLRPKSALARDESVLVGVRGISNVPELYYQYARYRYEVLEERMRQQQKKIAKRHDSRRDFDLAAARAFLTEQRDYIDSMLAELVEVE